MIESSDILSFPSGDEHRSCPEVRALLESKCGIEWHNVEYRAQGRVPKDGKWQCLGVASRCKGPGRWTPGRGLNLI
jgi:hypothetical protein